MPSLDPTSRVNGALTAAVHARIARPDVAADPQQSARRGVWTTRGDLLTSRPINDGDMVTATWAGTIWQAVAHWDRKDPDILWLTPTPMAAVPHLRAQYNRQDIVNDVVNELIFVGLLPEARYARLAAGVIFDTRLELLYDDVDEALDLAIRAAIGYHPKPPRMRLSELARPRSRGLPSRRTPKDG
jgi:hypothetical protein